MKLNFSIRAKLIGGFGMLVTLTALVAILAWQQTSALQETIRQTQGKEALLGRAESAIWELRWTLAQYMLLTDADSRRKITDGEGRLYNIVEENLNRFRDSPGLTREEMEGQKAVLNSFAKYVKSRPRFFQLMSENKLEEAAEWRAQATTKFGSETNNAFASLLDTTVRNDRARAEEQSAATQRMKFLLMALGASTVAIGLVAGYYIFRSIVGPLNRLQGAIKDVRDGGNIVALAAFEAEDEMSALGRTVNDLLTDQITAREKVQAENEQLNNSVISILQAVNQLSQKDLTARAPVTSDIIGTVSDSINMLADETTKVLAGVNNIAGLVMEGSGKVKTQADLVSKTAADDRKRVGEMIDALSGAAQATNHVETLAVQSNRNAEQATQATASALEAVNGTVEDMESIRETIAESEKRIKRLGERSQEITGIVGLINTLSERTHVLALNASMQAAVAGEAGRGFAVVAEEVQRLAESSRNATQQIGTLVTNIQLETNETIATVNRTIEQVVRGSSQAQKAGNQMRRTQEITDQLVAQVSRIAEGVEHQKEMSVQLLKSVHNLGESAERTGQQIDTQNLETAALLNSARVLVDSVGVFKLPREA